MELKDRHILSAALFFMFWCFCAPGPAHAETLGKAECLDLKAEKASLTKQGVAKRMKKGHEWAQANLRQDALNDIKRYIYIEEQLLFRCPMVSPTVHKKVEIKKKKKYVKKRK